MEIADEGYLCGSSKQMWRLRHGVDDALHMCTVQSDREPGEVTNSMWEPCVMSSFRQTVTVDFV